MLVGRRRRLAWSRGSGSRRRALVQHRPKIHDGWLLGAVYPKEARCFIPTLDRSPRAQFLTLKPPLPSAHEVTNS